MCIYIYIYIYILCISSPTEALRKDALSENQITEGASDVNEGTLTLMHIYLTYFVQVIVMIITISVFAISKGNTPFFTPETLQCVLQSKTLVLLAARKTQLLLKF